MFGFRSGFSLQKMQHLSGQQQKVERYTQTEYCPRPCDTLSKTRNLAWAPRSSANIVFAGTLQTANTDVEVGTKI